MGGYFSSPQQIEQPKEIPHDVQALYDRGACIPCIARILSMGKVEIQSYLLPAIHQEDCFACHGVLNHIDDIKNAINTAIGRYQFHDIQIEVVPQLIKNDNKLIIQYHCQTSSSLKNYIKARILLSFTKIKQGPVLQIKINSSQDIQASLSWPHLYITGRYYKRSRRVSNTRFMRGQKAISSVEKELISHIPSAIRCSDRKFLSAGREDMDVRMIGSGRPFCISLLNPLPNDDWPTVPQNYQDFSDSYAQFLPPEGQSLECDNHVSAIDLRISTERPDMTPKHEKSYRCIVSCSRNVTPENLKNIELVDNLTIQQRTPSRVAHRRIMATRSKTVISMSYKQICPRFLILDLKTSKGTYIKEFVNSDFGRTKPSFGEILDPVNPIECQLLQLDVIFVSE